MSQPLSCYLALTAQVAVDLSLPVVWACAIGARRYDVNGNGFNNLLRPSIRGVSGKWERAGKHPAQMSEIVGSYCQIHLVFG